MNLVNRMSFCTILMMGVVACMGTSSALGGTVYVSKTGDDANDGLTWATAKLTVQAGLNAAVSGDQVWVAAGTYVENIALKDGVALYGGFAGTESELNERNWVTNKTILDGNQANSVVTSPSGATTATRIDGFTIRNGKGYSGGGIYCYFSSPTIANNTITGNRATSFGGGVYCYDRSSPMIANNTITGNSASSGGGIYCSSSSPTIANNTITGNSATYGGGIYCSYSSPTIANNAITGNSASYGGGIYCSYSPPTIANNTITGNSGSSGGGIYCDYSSPTIANTIIAFNLSGIYKKGTATPTLRYNCVYGNTAYNYSGVTDPTGTNGNISADPKLADLAFGNVHIQSYSPCVDAGSNTYVFGEQDLDGQGRIQPAGGTVDIGADESDGSDWPAGPYTMIRIAPDGDDAHNGSSWALAKRTIQAGIDAAAALGGDVWVRAGTYNERITLHPYAYLYGGFAGTEDSRDERDWVTNASIIDGQQGGSVVSVRAGHQVSRIDGFTIRNGSDSGIYCYFSSLTIVNNTITGNSATFYGGGIYCSAYSPQTIANNTITGNSATYGGGVYCSSYSYPVIANNTITGNSATYGGGIECYSSSPTIANNTITGNSASSGDGIYCDSSYPTIANTIIAFNSSGIYISGGKPTLRYNCVYGNTAYNYSGVTDPTGTNGNISADPRFVQADPGTDGIWGTADDDFSDQRLLAASPCIDAGDNASVPAGITTDLTGVLRFLDNPDVPDTGAGTPPIVDMGAYEFFLPAKADFDVDGDVDGDDLEILAACATGPAVPYNPAALPEPEPGCTLTPDGNGHISADFDVDNDVDLDDFGVFQRCYSGEGNPADPNCAN